MMNKNGTPYNRNRQLKCCFSIPRALRSVCKPFCNKAFVLLFLGIITSVPACAQMLFTENMTMNIDSTKTIQGTLNPVVDFKTEQENVLTVKNTANLNVLLHHNRVINLIDKLEFSTYGKKITVSGGYVHMEYRYLLHHVFEIYPYAESQWAGSRGMTFKVSAGMQSRYRFVGSKHCLLFGAVALFYEFENWQYPNPPAGVASHAFSRSIKSHLSLSFKHTIGDRWELTTTAIHQAKPDSYLKSARFGGAVDLIYHITPTVGVRGAYRIIYDTKPIVPVRKNYTTVEAGLDIAF
mgnify:CR=1 FL=1